jgi:Domain of unknown function (DUF4919)
MRNFIRILILFLLANAIYGQEKIDFDYSKDYKVILSQTKSDTSRLFYPKLFQRFLVGDSTLTNYEVLALQIGYTDNDNYWPYQDIEMERDIWSLNEQMEFEKAVKTCDTLLNRNPFNILACREKSYAYKKLGMQDSADYYFDRFDKIVSCDLATGDGISYETSWFVISPADGQWIIKLAFHGNICFMGSGRDKSNNFHDILGFQRDNEDKQTKKKKKDEDCLYLYFNIEHAANRMLGKEGMK